MEPNLDAPWNADSSLPVEEWLTEFQSEQDRQRLKTMGNLVVPLQAAKALSVLSHVRRELD